MTRLLPLVVGVVAAAGCVRLGLWQLDRLEQRRAHNAAVERQRALDLVMLGAPGGPPVRGSADTSGLAFRRATATGRFELERQFVEMARSLHGAPGVYILTPLALADGRRVLVNRGWVYSADARTVDLARLAEAESTTVRGILVPPRSDPRAVRPDTLDPTFLPVLLRRTDLPSGAPAGLVALPAPAMDEGPHLSYAVQWFAFGTIALVGGVLLYVRDRARSRDADQPPAT